MTDISEQVQEELLDGERIYGSGAAPRGLTWVRWRAKAQPYAKELAQDWFNQELDDVFFESF